MDKIIIKDAYENNLKHINLEIPIEKFTCVTGCSGCGKSSLVFDTIYAESQRAFLEGMAGNIYGQKLMNKPKVGFIDNLRPALNVSQNYYNVNPRSTIGTTTEVSYYLRSLFAIVNSAKGKNITENIFSSNNPKSFCPHCAGLGIETVISKNLLIPDSNISLRDGGILYFKGPVDGREQKHLEALCEHYNIDIQKSISNLTEEELNILLYVDDQIKYKLTYKEGKRRKQHFINLKGAIPSILERVTGSDLSTSSSYAKYMEEVPCHVCGGAKFKKEVLEYKVGGLNYNDVESMELTSLYVWLKNYNYKCEVSPNKELVDQLITGILQRLDALIQLDVGYLSLNRSIPTLSGGEKQRIRLATQLTCSLKGLIYILDEPCKGLHYRDIKKVVGATNKLLEKGNTVIAIEHNKQYISASDYTIELGPVGGPEGGYLINNYITPKEVCYNVTFKQKKSFSHWIDIEDINYRNILHQSTRFPIGGITCITGVSGSGKSTLAEVIIKCFSNKSSERFGVMKSDVAIRKVIQVNQSPIGKTPRSTIASYLDIFDEIRLLFSKTEDAKKKKIGTSAFSMNVKGGRCECCQGTGLQKIELNYLPSSYITCPECGGKRYNDDVLSIKYKGKTILDILESPIFDIVDVFEGTKKISSTLKSMIQLGLGYLKLGQMSMNLSGGEAQRVKLAKALSSSTHGTNLYILDEPTSGLNEVDINKFLQVIFSLQENKETIVIIEHNIEFISQAADYIIDFGLHGGADGGKIVAQGTPKSIFDNKYSSLYDLDK